MILDTSLSMEAQIMRVVRLAFYHLCQAKLPLPSYEMAVKSVKHNFYSATIASADSRPAQLFKVVRSLTALIEGQQNSSQLDISCEAFASHFADKISTLRHDLPPTLDTKSELEAPWPSLEKTMSNFRRLTLTEVDRILATTRPTTCPLDPCPSWLLKTASIKIMGPLQEIINLSLTTGEFPEGLKEAVVRPLLKKTSLNPQEPNNYRPVSHLAFLGKMIERAVANQLTEYLEEASVLDPSQSGFRPGHGVETALVALTDDLRRQLDRGGSALLILLDLSAAFDTVDHELLARRLIDAGIQGTALQWLISFLQDRGKRVAIGEKTSGRRSNGLSKLTTQLLAG
ncbi:uncharacterized protein LOC143830542 [Paroedura picta]|uniref:uncharacterized protein LOC143830542 n=1 Tax=Paroedura picta TaxID=143630 RepID=UPI004056C2C9